MKKNIPETFKIVLSNEEAADLYQCLDLIEQGYQISSWTHNFTTTIVEFKRVSKEVE